ncbi:MAG: hypothetical protein NTW69_17465 [Chloroflexi bacterium]|nr:hypothetical protein [Chloroflexota bacterium]
MASKKVIYARAWYTKTFASNIANLRGKKRNFQDSYDHSIVHSVIVGRMLLFVEVYLRVLAKELDMEPLPATEALYQRLLENFKS